MSEEEAPQETGAVSPRSSPEPTHPVGKRKRTDAANEEEIEVNVDAPEPPSKKAKRQEKKAAAREKAKKEQPPNETDAPTTSVRANGETVQSQRGEYGIWIGNLPFTATKDTIREFLRNEGGIESKDVTRLHMPAPTEKSKTAQNKGFAYIDFSSQEIMLKALILSEKLMSGRRVLIKDAKSFEGRPIQQPKEGEEKKSTIAKEPTKKVFVGNLGFDVTREELTEHFKQAGQVEDIFLATFQDSGKCKGFGWVRFADEAAASAAVRGYFYVDADDDNGEEVDETEEAGVVRDGAAPKQKRDKPKQRRRYINRLYGRQLRCEFAEDAQTRYKKRFGKGARSHDKSNVDETSTAATNAEPFQAGPRSEHKQQHRELDKDQRRDLRRRRHDARTIAPGRALANTPRASASIVAGAGKKITFDE